MLLGHQSVSSLYPRDDDGGSSVQKHEVLIIVVVLVVAGVVWIVLGFLFIRHIRRKKPVQEAVGGVPLPWAISEIDKEANVVDDPRRPPGAVRMEKRPSKYPRSPGPRRSPVNDDPEAQPTPVQNSMQEDISQQPTSRTDDVRSGVAHSPQLTSQPPLPTPPSHQPYLGAPPRYDELQSQQN